MLGQVLNNRYSVTARLGKGAMGTVYRATDSQTGRQVALKVIATDLALDPGMLERFKREGEALRQLRHPNIVGFVDAFEYQDQYIIVMEYIPGGSLQELISKGPIAIEQARRIALELCDALIRSHHLNIIHRDIKPENVLIAEDGTPKLADFGVARLSEGTRMTRSGTQVGTPYYMSPEAWEGQPLDAQADIWSLGVVLFEMLTGQVPFGGDTGPVVMKKVLTTQPPDLKRMRAEVPIGLAKTVTRMLARDPRRRYQSMREVGVDLERGDQSIATRAQKISKPRAVPMVAILLGVGVLCVAAIAGAVVKSGLLAGLMSGAPASAAAVSPGSIKIVSSLPMTGSEQDQTQSLVNAMQLRLDQANNKACAGKIEISFAPWDDSSAAAGGSDPKVEGNNAAKAAADNSIVAYLGPYDSDAAKVSIPILNAAGPLTMISPTTTEPGLTKTDLGAPGATNALYPTDVRNYARIIPTDEIQGQVAANFLKFQLNKSSVYILTDEELYTKNVADAFEASAKDDGLTIVGRDVINSGAANYKQLMTKIATSNGGRAPDAIYAAVPVYNNAGQLLKNKVAAMGDNSKVIYLGFDSILGQDFIDSAGAIPSEGVYSTSTVIDRHDMPASAQPVIDAYKNKYGAPPEYYGLYGFEAMNVLLQAIENVCASGGDPTRRVDVNTAVHMIKNFVGVLGTWSFDANGDTSLTDLTIYQVQSGQFADVGVFK